MEYFQDELRALENCASTLKSAFESSSRTRDFTASNLLTNNGSINEISDRRSCVYCQRVHLSSKCRTVTNVKARKDLLRKFDRCFLCLDKGHFTHQCQSSYRCRRGNKGRHHISICDSNQDKGSESVNHQNQDPLQVSTDQTSTKSSILLQTASASISSIEGGMKCSARILFDSGSQRTYITENVRKRLQLKSHRKENVVLNTFGQVSSTMKSLDVVQIRVRHKNSSSSTFIEALVVPSICTPLSGQDLAFASVELPHLTDLQFADCNDFSQKVTVDILVGLDFYHQFISGKIITGEVGPVALESVLGWVISGPLCDMQETSVHCNQVHTMRCSTQEDNSALKETLDKF